MPGGHPATGSRAVAADIADEHAVASLLFDQAEQAYGGIDVVVNAACAMSLAPLADFDLAVLDRMHRTHIRATFVVDQQASRRVARSRIWRRMACVGCGPNPAESVMAGEEDKAPPERPSRSPGGEWLLT